MDRSARIWTLIAASLGVTAIGVGVFLDTRRGRSVPSRPSLPPRSPDPYRPPSSSSSSSSPAPTSPAPVEPAWTSLPGAHTLGGMTYSPLMESWRPLLTILGYDVPIMASMSWNAEESGGNVCSIGGLPAHGQAMPQEYGLGQLNAQDPSNLKIATPQNLRRACKNSGTTRAEWQTLLRPLTEAERIENVTASLDLMRQCRKMIRPYVATFGWSETGPDFWQMVKLWHASPAIVSWTPAIVKHLGRAPHDFAELQSQADAIGLANQIGHAHEGGTRGYLDSVWLNVHRIGAAMTPPSVGV